MMNTRYFLSALALSSLLGASVPPALAADGPEPKSADTATAVADTVVTASVKAKFLGDSRLKGSNISVTTANGVVSLTGTAPSADARDAAEEIARRVDGVKNVDNLIEYPSIATKVEKSVKTAAVKTEQATSDGWITTKVKSALLADSLTKGLKISVNTTRHVVVLAGSADTQEAADRAVEVARKVQGVESVDNSGLKVGKH